MLQKYLNKAALAHLALAALPYVGTHLAHLPGVYGVIGSCILQLVALYTEKPAKKAGT